MNIDERDGENRLNIQELQEKLKGAKGVIFDVDGVILDSMPIWDDCDRIFLKKMGKTPEDNLSDIMFTMTMPEGIHYLKTHYDVEVSEEEILAMLLEIVADYYRDEVPMKTGMKELILALREQGTKLLVATSNERPLIDSALKRHGILDCFQEILICSEVGAGKSEPLIFEKALEKMELAAEEVYLVEDGLYSMKTGKELGLKIIGIYDSRSDGDWEEIQGIADYCVKCD